MLKGNWNLYKTLTSDQQEKIKNRFVDKTSQETFNELWEMEEKWYSLQTDPLKDPKYYYSEIMIQDPSKKEGKDPDVKTRKYKVLFDICR